MNITLPSSTLNNEVVIYHHQLTAGSWANHGSRITLNLHINTVRDLNNIAFRLRVTNQTLHLFYAELERSYQPLNSWNRRTRDEWGVYTDRIRLWGEVETENVTFHLQGRVIHVVLEKVDGSVVWPALMSDDITGEPLVEDWMVEMTPRNRREG